MPCILYLFKGATQNSIAESYKYNQCTSWVPRPRSEESKAQDKGLKGTNKATCLPKNKSNKTVTIVCSCCHYEFLVHVLTKECLNGLRIT